MRYRFRMNQPVTDRRFIALGALFGLTGVAAGAFGAHGLRDHLSADMMAVYRTAVDYQLWHTAALLAVGLLATRGVPARALTAAGVSFTAGIVVFSGTLYALSLSGVRWLGAITPIGGVCLIVGWALLGWWALRPAKARRPEQNLPADNSHSNAA